MFVSGALLGVAILTEPHPAWPSQNPSLARAGQAHELGNSDAALIEAQPVCIASSVWSAGELGQGLAYHYRREGDRLEVGYFAFWSTERPWGANALTLTLLPAAAIDAVYSHFMYILPGVQSVLYGPGDVEGATISYRIMADNSLIVLRGVAQDGLHADVELSREDMLDTAGRIILMSDVWSHQLGGKRAAERLASSRSEHRCFSRNSLVKLANRTIIQFRLGSASAPRRAKAAWRPLLSRASAPL